MESFLGRPIPYWVELQKRVDALKVEHLLKDLAEAHAKVSYYEMMHKRMEDFRNCVDKGSG